MSSTERQGTDYPHGLGEPKGEKGLIGEKGQPAGCLPLTSWNEKCVHLWTKTTTNYTYRCIKCNSTLISSLSIPPPRYYHTYQSVRHEFGSNYEVVQCTYCNRIEVTQLTPETCTVQQWHN